MQEPQPDWSSPTQSLRVRWEIERNRKGLVEIDHPETAQVFPEADSRRRGPIGTDRGAPDLGDLGD